jgi:hypothetical protein
MIAVEIEFFQWLGQDQKIELEMSDKCKLLAVVQIIPFLVGNTANTEICGSSIIVYKFDIWSVHNFCSVYEIKSCYGVPCWTD